MPGVKLIRRLLLVVFVGLVGNQPGWAVNECGSPNSRISCSIDVNEYASGILYVFVDDEFVDGVALTLESGASVVADDGKVGLGIWDLDPNDLSVIGSNLIHFTLNLVAGSSIEVSAANVGNPYDSIAGLQLSTNARITATIGGDIKLKGLLSKDHGYEAAAVHVQSERAVGERYVHQLGGSTIRGDGFGTFGISLIGYDSSTNAVLRSDGTIEFTGDLVTGVAVSDRGQANNVSQVLLGSSSRIDVSGTTITGAYAMQTGLGSARVDAAGRVKARGLNAQGLLSINTGSGREASLLLRDTGQVTAIGDFGTGLASMTAGTGDALVTSHGRVSVQGAGTLGIAAVIFDGGISLPSTERAVVQLQGAASVKADGKASHGVLAFADSGVATGSVYTSAGTSVQVNGAGAVGIGTFSLGDGLAQISGEAKSRGDHGAAVMVRSQQAGARVVVGPSADISGGWQADLAGRSMGFVAPQSEFIYGDWLGFDLLASGVTLSGATSVELENAGRIGALSDRAVHIDGCLQNVVCAPASASITNAGVITGFVENSTTTPVGLTNSKGGEIVLRHFADTDGDGTRDTKRVAISDFGGARSGFTNASGAKVTLGAVAGAGAVSSDHYYVSSNVSASDYRFAADGRVQAQLVRLSEFANSGTLDLRGKTTGNSLVVTSNAAAGGVAGNGVFVANGGTLLLNTHFNEGMPSGGTGNSLSDMLIVDKTRLGSAPTTIAIDRRSGTGAVTPGNGILLVEVRNKTASQAGVFTLAGDYVSEGEQYVMVGPHSYRLAHNGVEEDSADGNWYLRNTGFSPSVQAVSLAPEAIQSLIVPNSIGQTSRVALFRSSGSAQSRGSSNEVASEIDLLCGAQAVQCVLTEQDVRYQVQLGDQVVDNRGVWARVYGAQGQHQVNNTGAQRGFKYATYGVQGGVDHLLADVGSGLIVGGVSARTGQTSGKSDLGSIVATGAGMGVSVTYFGDEGLLLGVEAEGLFYSADITSAILGPVKSELPGFGYSVRALAAQRVELGEGWSVTPETELIYSNVNFSPFTDPWGAQIDMGTTESLKLRGGVGVERQHAWKTEKGRDQAVKAFAKLDLEHEFLGQRQISVSGTKVNSGVDLTWVGASVGGEYHLDGDKALVFGEVGVSTSLDNFGSSYELRGNLGFKLRF